MYAICMYSVLYCVMHEHHNSICTNQIKSNRIHVGIALLEPFFNPGIRDWEIYNPGIDSGGITDMSLLLAVLCLLL